MTDTRELQTTAFQTFVASSIFTFAGAFMLFPAVYQALVYDPAGDLPLSQSIYDLAVDLAGYALFALLPAIAARIILKMAGKYDNTRAFRVALAVVKTALVLTALAAHAGTVLILSHLYPALDNLRPAFGTTVGTIAPTIAIGPGLLISIMASITLIVLAIGPRRPLAPADADGALQAGNTGR